MEVLGVPYRITTRACDADEMKILPRL
ncbi:uncharacterized protein G2W53_010069 [Senna tora]|uniref:Uncharacterized protein n=1 Tax=Senna tora TaxID=362788 RepID=A0A834WZS5_9FABA|nr:uncharacterized protein G2W53_010069 [Senna tora]